MNIIIAGNGDLSFYVAKFLLKEKHSISIIDTDTNHLKSFESNSEVLTYEGSSTSVNTLKDAGVDDCDILIAVHRDENVNITSCILAKNLGARQTIARIDNVEFLDEKNAKAFQVLGVDAMICPEKVAASEIVHLINQTAATEIIDFSDKSLSLLLFRLDENSKVLNKSLTEVAKENPDILFRAVAIHRNSVTIIPCGSDIFTIDDMVYVIAGPEGIDELLKLSGKTNFKINKVFIAGGSRIGRKTAMELQKYKDVYLIEKDEEKIQSLLNVLTNSYIIKGDVRNTDLLKSENIEDVDAFIAVTNNSETNILSSLIAKKFNIKRIITLVENIEFIDIAQKVGIEAIVNKKIITASHIARFILKDKVLALNFLTGIDAEVLELVVYPKSQITKKPICKLGFPSGAIIGGYIRDKKGFIARGDTQIMEGDKVVVFTLPGVVDKVLRFFN
ncbi:MAG: Trk system potassium transporter TrkA [Bacteroidales bacterium]|nr:Trk system potassium transporter TrkA [Bacteroidales bacterium]